MRSRLHAFVREDGITDLEAALRACALLGVDLTHSPDEGGVALYERGEAYLVAYAEAKLDQADFRLDDWDPDQPRDEKGMFAATGAGTVEGAVKSGESAISKAVTFHELQFIEKKLEKSKVLKGEAAGQVYNALADKAKEFDMDYVAGKFAAKAAEHGFKPTALSHEDAITTAKAMALQGKAPDEIIAHLTSAGGMSAEDAMTAVNIGHNQSTSPEAEGGYDGDEGYQGDEGTSFPHPQMIEQASSVADLKAMDDQLKQAFMEQADDPSKYENASEAYMAMAHQAGQLGDSKLEEQYFAMHKQHEKSANAQEAPANTSGGVYPDGSPEAAAHAALTAIGIKDPTPAEIKTKAASMAKAAGKPPPFAHNTIDIDPKTGKPVGGKMTPAMKAVAVEEAVKSSAGKSQTQLDHSKEARESAKKIVQHAKDLRADYKKNPTPEKKAKLEAAEKAAKAARSAARKAEKAKSPEEAKKHAEKAHAHHAKLLGGDDEAQAYQVTKGGTETSKPSKAAPAKTTGGHAELTKKADKLKEAANAPHPDSWTPDKIAAKEAAKDALEKHAGATTPAELKAAAKAFKDVAAKASAAGSYWGHSYSSLADEYEEKSTPQEEFAVGGKGGDNDHSEAPSKSHRPIADIQGDVVSTKAHDKHRTEYTKTLSSKQKAAALKYSGGSYTTINGNLRKDGKPTESDLHLDAAIAKSPAPRDMLVHRGMSGDFSKNLFENMKPGDQYVEKAYTSTSAGGDAAFGGNVELHITVPKGYPVAPIPSHHPGEREYLLRRNTRYQVTKIEKQGSKVVAHVTVVHDKEEK